MEEELKQQVIGQDEAVIAISKALRWRRWLRPKSGLRGLCRLLALPCAKITTPFAQPRVLRAVFAKNDSMTFSKSVPWHFGQCTCLVSCSLMVSTSPNLLWHLRQTYS